MLEIRQMQFCSIVEAARSSQTCVISAFIGFVKIHFVELGNFTKVLTGTAGSPDQ